MRTPSSPVAVPAGWRVVAASVPGTSHQKANLSCQDAVRWEVLPGGCLIGALADGAGSASFAEVGANLAVQRALATLTARLAAAGLPSTEEVWPDLLRDSLNAARAAVVAEADARQVRPRELATTLVLLAATPVIAAAAQIGDGAALVAEAPDQLTSLTRPSIAEYLNETTFLTSDQALEAAQICVRRGNWRYAALLCDGLQLLALKLPEAKPHARFFQPLFRFLDRAADLPAAGRELAGFLQSPRITERADDDLTLLLASRGEVVSGPPPSPTHGPQ